MPFPIVSSAQTSLGNGTYCTLIAPVPFGSLASPFPAQCQVFDLASYNIQLNSGVSAGTATFQELFTDGSTWLPLASPAPVSLVFATTASYNGILNGPFLGLRVVVTGLTGGTIAQVMLKASIRSL
jgi:hypothetical protein